MISWVQSYIEFSEQPTSQAQPKLVLSSSIVLVSAFDKIN